MPRIEMSGRDVFSAVRMGGERREQHPAIHQGHGDDPAPFPTASLETYAVQEPCWASCLPQILRSLGFTAAVLKDPGNRVGRLRRRLRRRTGQLGRPGRHAIPTVPRYACEDVVKVYETESGNPTPEFARKCVEHGIRHPGRDLPAGSGLGRQAAYRQRDFIRYVTWREYFHHIADPPSKNWNFSIEDILTTLPWGEKRCNWSRSRNGRPKIAFWSRRRWPRIAWMEDVPRGPRRELTEAWDNLLWAQGHDPWITATTRTGRQAWAFQVAAGTMQTEEAANPIVNDASGFAAGGNAARRRRPAGDAVAARDEHAGRRKRRSGRNQFLH